MKKVLRESKTLISQFVKFGFQFCYVLRLNSCIDITDALHRITINAKTKLFLKIMEEAD